MNPPADLIVRAWRRVAVSGCVLLLAACSGPSGGKLPDGVLYQEDFESDQGSWVLETDLDAAAHIADGQLHLDVASPNLISWAELDDQTFDDFVLEVDASQVAGPDNNSYGVIFRVRNPSAYYRFDISGDGYFAFSRRDDTDGGRWTWITADWVASPAINQGMGTNRIRILAQGSHFEFYVNGQRLTAADDTAYRAGAIGLNAGTFDQGNVSVSFDNLLISQP